MSLNNPLFFFDPIPNVNLGILATGALGLGSVKYLREQSGTFPIREREYYIRPWDNSTMEQTIVKNMDIKFCKVWHSKTDMIDILYTLLILILPLVMGPMLTIILELIIQVSTSPPKPRYSEENDRVCQIALLHVLAWFSAGSYLANLYLAEGVLLNVYNFKIFYVLVLKYVVGYADLLYVPLLLMFLDRNVREGVGEVYRSRTNQTRSSHSDITSVFSV